MRITYSVSVVLFCTVALYSCQHPPGIPPQPPGHAPVHVNPNLEPSQMRVEEGRRPGDGPHGHGHGGGFNRQSVHDKEHIKDHLKEVVDKPKDQMTEEELEFHYFKLHDYDGNNKLDGVEIGKALTHYHQEEEEEKDPNVEHHVKAFSDDEISSIVDLVLKEDDLDGDGYIEYVEFVTAQRKARDDVQEKP